jgi:hypothetical protein
MSDLRSGKNATDVVHGDGVSKPDDPAKAPGPSSHYDDRDPQPIPLWDNLITLCGVFLVVISIILLLTFGLFTIITPAANPYVDIVGYIALPGLLVAGLLVAPIGIFFKHRRIRREDPGQTLVMRIMHIDWTDTRQRRVVKFFLIITFLMLPIMGVSGYHGYHYTDSVEFCAQACHSVMEPQAISYESSSHARVSCAECHIGSGASWFVKSKLSGTRQVFATLWETYPRPIPNALSQLRPARDTCEQCHWPQKFYGAQLSKRVRFSSDETNTRHDIDMLLKIGGGDDSHGPPEGIHAHMAIGTIEYIATDENLQHIPWVRWTDPAGRERVFRSDDQVSADPVPSGQFRQLDCMDCHNRPAHKFRAPQDAVDHLMAIGKVATTLPFIKREAVAALVKPYADDDAARSGIRNHLVDFYSAVFPEVWTTQHDAVEQAIEQIRVAYEQNMFPNMKVDWRTYPDNIGHMHSAGCFRCHDGHHVDEAGVAIGSECNTCHSFFNAVDPTERNGLVQPGEYQHPFELVGKHNEMMCHNCHTGGTMPPPTCDGCHADSQSLHAGTPPAELQLLIEPDVMLGSVECVDCHDLTEPSTLAAVDVMCMDCHEDEEDRFEGMLRRWAGTLAAAQEEAYRALANLEAGAAQSSDTSAWLSQSRTTLDWLRRAGPLHNYGASLTIYQDIAAEAERRLRDE